ncbi:carboxymuconolactone decarboxylase family protein [Niallia sp. 01092]|uniref:carboxymuconolactone decarboxylase family protein n=1 Tax=unclassified Niallia TaxID=2837522 RepID=UPI003FD3DCDF
MGLAISIVSRCDECICYHMEGCLNAGATIDEIMETLKIGVIGAARSLIPTLGLPCMLKKNLQRVVLFRRRRN